MRACRSLSHKTGERRHRKKSSPMTAFTFSVEQLRSAPPEVRRWIEREIAASLTALSKTEHDPSQIHAAALGACTPEEASQVFELIKSNFLLAEVFFELALRHPTVTAQRRSIRSASPISCVIRGSAMATGSSIALLRSIGRSSRSATILQRHYLGTINSAMYSFTRLPTTAFASFGNCCSGRMRQSQADRTSAKAQCRPGSQHPI
jgi:hypothetical protein